MALNNYDVAVMTALNELGQRYGLEPFDLDASIHIPESGPEVRIRFETPPPPAKQRQYWRLMNDLGIGDPNGPELSGTEESVWATVQGALKRAPKQTGRRL